MTDPVDPLWYHEHKRRWPLDLGVVVSALLVVWSIAAGYGARLAKSEEPGFTQALREMQPPSLADGENAAPLWGQAVSAYVPWRKLELNTEADLDAEVPHRSMDPTLLTRKDLRRAETFAVDSPLCRWLRANQSAMELSRLAAQTPACDWPVVWVRGLLAFMEHKPLMESRDLGRLAMKHGTLAAYEGRWDAVVEDVEQIVTLARHQGKGPGIIAYLMEGAGEGMAVGLVQASLSVPGSRITTAARDRLLAIAREGAAHTRDLRPYLVFERAGALQQMARLASGEVPLMPSSATSLNAAMPVIQAPIPAALNLYAPLYIFDRAALITMHARWTIDPVTELPRDGYRATGAWLMTGLMAPGTTMLARLGIESTWRWRIAQVALAITAWADAHDEVWPTRLDNLPLSPDLFQDPWMPTSMLKLRTNDDGSLDCWSVGKNQRDDTPPPAAENSQNSSGNDDILFHLASRRTSP